MAAQDLRAQEKKEQLQEKGEKTEVGRYFIPDTDIHESSDALIVTMEMPGVHKDNVDIQVEDNVLSITGIIDFSSYEDLKPIYTEYNIGNYMRSFNLSSEIDKDGISAKIEDGVLMLHLPKVKKETAKKIIVE